MKLKFQFALTILLTILILNSCEKENPDAISNNDSNNNITSIEEICNDAAGSWVLEPSCPAYEIPELDIYIDVEERFEDTITLVCVNNERLLISFYGQMLYADINEDGALIIPNQQFEADFSQEALEGLEFLSEDAFITLQIGGNGEINASVGTLNVTFSFTLMEDLPFSEMTDCTLSLSR